MDNRGYVAVRRILPGTCNSTSAEVVAGSAAWLGKGLSCVCAQRSENDAQPSFDFTPEQEECLQRLQKRVNSEYDSSFLEHQSLGKTRENPCSYPVFLSFTMVGSLEGLWMAAFPGKELQGLISEQWKDMGWQGKDPSTDFRGGGFISLENLLYFARNYQKSFQDLLRKQEGDWALWECPFAVAAVDFTFMLIQCLDLETAKPQNLVGATFLKFLAEDKSAFDLLYCITFKLMYHQWLAMHASYIDFNVCFNFIGGDESYSLSAGK